MIRAAVARILLVPLLGVTSVVAAQTAPYQSSQRSAIGRGVDRVELPPGGYFEPRVESAAQYVENIGLATDGDEQIDTAGIEVAPGFYASYSSRTLEGAIDYSLIGRFWDESDYDDVSHRLEANGQWYAVPEWFSLRGQASYADAIMDPTQGLAYGSVGAFGASNLQEVASGSASAVLQHYWGQHELDVEYTYGRAWYLDQGKGLPVDEGIVINAGEDSVDERAAFGFGIQEPRSPLTYLLHYEWDKSEYETSLPYEYESGGLDAGVLLSNTFRLVGGYGLESDFADGTTNGGLDSEYWNAGFRWSPNDRTHGEARYGERFFGNTYLVDVAYRTRMFEFTASYVEEPTVETRKVSLGDFDPGELPPDLPDPDFGGLTSSPYVGKDGRVGFAAVGSRTRVGVNGFYSDREYLTGERATDTTTGALLEATRQLASNLSVDLNVSYAQYEGAGLESDPDDQDVDTHYDTLALVRLNRAAGAHLTLGMETGYLTRSGSSPYDAWWVAVRLRWTP